MATKIRHLLFREGRYYARVVVPKDLRKNLGKTELRMPLGADRREAIRKHPAAIARLQTRISDARRRAIAEGLAPRGGPSRPVDLATLAYHHYAELLELDSRARNISPDLAGVTVPEINGWSLGPREKVLRHIASGAASEDETRAVLGVWIDELHARGTIACLEQGPQWRELARTLASVHLEALQRARERDQGDFSGEPKLRALTVAPPEIEPVLVAPLGELFQAYISMLSRSGNGAEAGRRWRPVFESLVKYLGHDDAAQITRADLLRWRESLEPSLSPKTIRDVYVAAVKTVLRWASENGRIASNPADRIKIRIGRTQKTREKGFTNEEAKRLLKAAKQYEATPSANPSTRESSHMVQAKRWIPWLCAFTGARVAEIAQIRKEDVRREGEWFFLRITPEAGSTKTGEFRDVPLHPQLVELGFISFVDATSHGPIFYSLSKRRSSQHPAKFVAQRLAVWIRTLGAVGDVQPNHGWRHRFKTIGRELGIDQRTLDAIQGHAARTAGEAYGSVNLKTMAEAVRRFPWIELEAP
ncbi:DUF6538 domain-containing protein [Methylocystis sp. Sn-Cys]|uniref:DUF6538 domain-containing protein n=1 Tax=Methylocystis sp. Sn-Cys TaxID=1701263 RepID=UPI001921B6FD|nr:DUF6538 domain-containing protein [Methylocystis sp. Sn-Cys]MBL1258618.1 tyrosine-type recombinase/integrase [Methylocystis sp. Sn-Cys]